MMLISFDLCAQMGFLKKTDINDGIYLTYNILSKVKAPKGRYTAIEM